MEDERRRRRPPTLTKEIADRILKHISRGMAIGTACVLEGYSHGSGNHWRLTAKREYEGGAHNDPYVAACMYFHEEIPAAKAKHESGLVDGWNASPDWRAKEAMLAARYPQKWGHRTRNMYLVVDLYIAAQNRDLPKMLKLLGSANTKTLMRFLDAAGMGDQKAPSVQTRTDAELAAKAEVLFANDDVGPDEVADAPQPE